MVFHQFRIANDKMKKISNFLNTSHGISPKNSTIKVLRLKGNPWHQIVQLALAGRNPIVSLRGKN